jgi:hypothetical protein
MNPLRIFYLHASRNFVAYLALFVALASGTAFAAGKITSNDIARNAVKAKHIKDGQVRTAELGANAVTGAKIGDDSITGADIDESTLQLPAAAPVASSSSSTPSTSTPSTPSTPSEPSEPDLTGFVKVVAQGYLTGPGPLSAADRCNSVGTEAPGVGFGDQVLITPGQLNEEVVYTAAVTSADQIAYQACYTGSGSVPSIGADVRYMVLRTQS